MIEFRVGKKFYSIPRMNFRTFGPAAGAAALPPYLAGGIPAANCVRAYTPKGAASLAASYDDLTGNEDATVVNPPEIIGNPGFESVAAAGPPANFNNWTEVASDGNVEVETTSKHSGSNACKLTCGATTDATRPRVYQQFAVNPGTTYDFSFWTRGDGTNAGKYSVYDVTHSSDITAETTTGVTGTTYSQVSTSFTPPSGCANARISLWSPAVNGGVSYFDDASVKSHDGIPGFDAATGWQFTDYAYKALTTGFIPGSATSIVCRLSGKSATENQSLYGVRDSNSARFYFEPRVASSKHTVWLGNYATAQTPNVASGVVIVTVTGCWVDGVQKDTISATWGNITRAMTIGCLNNVGSPGSFVTANIQCWWAYDIDLNTSTYIADLTTAAQAL